MGIYFGGDRDDANNYSSNDWQKKPKPTLQQVISQNPTLQKGITLPKEFDAEFYIYNKNRYSSSSPDYWEWSKFNAYANAVFAFYRQVAVQFYSKFPPQNPKSVPYFIDFKIKPQDVNLLAEAVQETEKALSLQFSSARTNRTINSKFNKHVSLRQLRKHAATAWVMFNALKQNLHIEDSINFKNSYSNLNLNTELGLLKAFRGCKVMQHYVGTTLTPNFLIKKLHLNQTIYAEEDGQKIYNNLVTSVGGFGFEDYEQISSNISKDVQALKNNASLLPIVYIYENYEYIHFLIKENLRLADDYYGGNTQKICIFQQGEEDLYQQAVAIKDYLQSALNLGLDPLFEKDINMLCKRLEHAINYASTAYKQSSL